MPQPTQPVRFALAGFGAWGKYHAQSIAADPDAALIAICAPSSDTRDEAKRLYPDCRLYSDPLAMIREEEFEILDVVTPSHTHREIGLAAIDRGRHLLLEKPMALSVVDCKQLIDAAQQNGIQIAVGHELRLSSQWGEIKKILEAGTIGNPHYVLVELSRKPYRLGADGWRYDPKRVGSWVLEEPIHFFDLARWYLEDAGDPIELVAYANSKDAVRPNLYDNFSAMFRYANGAYGVVSQTLAAFEHHQTVKISGSRGALWAGWSGSMDRTLEPMSFLKVFDGHELKNIELKKRSGEVFELQEEIARCVRMVRFGEPPAATGLDGLWSTGLCLLAEESIQHQRPIEINKLI